MARPREIDWGEVIRTYRLGLSYRQTAAYCKISERSCARILKEAGIGRAIALANRMKFPGCEKKWKNVIALYKAGFSGARIAEQVGYHEGHVRRIVREAGVSRTLKEAAAIRPIPPTIALHNGYRRRRRRYDHRAVMEEMLGRKLKRDEVVHHKNGDRTDNRPENLEVLSNSEHMRMHRAKKFWRSR